MVGHVTPEAFDGGPIALVEEGDTITIDMSTKTITLVSSIYDMIDHFLFFIVTIIIISLF